MTTSELIRVVPELGSESTQVVDSKELAARSGISRNPLSHSELGVFQYNPIQPDHLDVRPSSTRTGPAHNKCSIIQKALEPAR
jgi:hypothetical protein